MRKSAAAAHGHPAALAPAGANSSSPCPSRKQCVVQPEPGNALLPPPPPPIPAHLSGSKDLNRAWKAGSSSWKPASRRAVFTSRSSRLPLRSASYRRKACVTLDRNACSRSYSCVGSGGCGREALQGMLPQSRQLHPSPPPRNQAPSQPTKSHRQADFPAPIRVIESDNALHRLQAKIDLAQGQRLLQLKHIQGPAPVLVDDLEPLPGGWACTRKRSISACSWTVSATSRRRGCSPSIVPRTQFANSPPQPRSTHPSSIRHWRFSQLSKHVPLVQLTLK